MKVFALILCLIIMPLSVFGAGSDSMYLQLSNDVLVNGSAVLLSATVNGGQLIHVQSDGRFYPFVPTGPSYVYIAVDGIRVSNNSTIDWHWGTTSTAQHSYEAVGTVNLASGLHTVQLVAAGSGSFYVGAGSNLSIMTHPAASVASSSLAADTSAFQFNIPAGYPEGSPLFPTYGASILSTSLSSTGAPIVALASGRTYWGGSQSNQQGDAMWNLSIDGVHERNDWSSWSDNDMCSCAEYQAPMFSHGFFTVGAGSHSAALDLTAEPWSAAQGIDPVKYVVGATTELVLYSGGMTVYGSSVQNSQQNTRFAGICVGSNSGWPGCPATFTFAPIATASFFVPLGSNGIVFFSGMTRIQADPSDAGGNALLNLRIDGATVGSTGVQQLNNGTAVSTRTLSASYLSAPPNGAALAPGWHTVQLGVNASGSFIHLTAFKDLPLLWFD